MIETIEVSQTELKHRSSSDENKKKLNGNVNSSTSDENQVKVKEPVEWKWEFDWWLIIYLTTIHIGAFYGLYRFWFCSWFTVLFTYVYAVFCGIGVTAGAHRLWSHKAYKAKLPLRIFLAILFTATWQKPIITWCVNHRVHHKYSDTDADPHNANRGFFFSHMGWLMIKPHPDCIEKKNKIPQDDLWADPVIYWQYVFFHPLAILLAYVVPTLIPIYAWGEDPWNAFFVAGMLRNTVVLQSTFTVNSLAHMDMWGYKKFDVNIKPVKNNFVTWLTSGEGFHNYHHTFPRDYAACEYSNHRANKTTKFIDFMAWLGLAYDRHKVDPEIVNKRRMRTGDWSLKKDKEAEANGTEPNAATTQSDDEEHDF